MNNGIVTSPKRPQLSAKACRSLLACGLWVRAAFVGASATAIGLIQFFGNEWSTPTAATTAVAGVALALVSYRRAQAALSDAGERSTVSRATPAAALR